MINNLLSLLTYENIYLAANWGVVPFWLLLIFWLHFLAISLFVGSWIVRDSKRYFIPKVIIIPSLILTYFSGPIGLVIYWFFRIFFAKKISFND